jgi:hypothetical protein
MLQTHILLELTLAYLCCHRPKPVKHLDHSLTVQLGKET